MKRVEFLTQNVLLWGITNPDCMIWPYAINKKDGYGRCWVEQKVALTHVVAYVIVKGKIPEGYELDHTCENTGCYNPGHLDPVTRAEHNSKTNERAGGHYNSRKTVCVNGHALVEENLVLSTKEGIRSCLECRRRNSRESMRRKRNKKES